MIWIVTIFKISLSLLSSYLYHYYHDLDCYHLILSVTISLSIFFTCRAEVVLIMMIKIVIVLIMIILIMIIIVMIMIIIVMIVIIVVMIIIIMVMIMIIMVMIMIIMITSQLELRSGQRSVISIHFRFHRTLGFYLLQL